MFFFLSLVKHVVGELLFNLQNSYFCAPSTSRAAEPSTFVRGLPYQSLYHFYIATAVGEERCVPDYVGEADNFKL